MRGAAHAGQQALGFGKCGDQQQGLTAFVDPRAKSFDRGIDRLAGFIGDETEGLAGLELAIQRDGTSKWISRVRLSTTSSSGAPAGTLS
jgi:hypothetical protein